MKPAHLAFVLLIDAVWAVNAVAIKFALFEVPPLTAVLLRYLVVFVVALPWLRVVKGRMGAVLIAGLVSGALYMGLGAISFSVTRNIAALAIAGQLGVPFSLILAVLLLGETIRLPRIAGVSAAFVGVAVMGFDPAIWDERLGLGLAVAASLVWAVGSLLFRRLQGVSALTIHAWLALASLPVLLAASLIFEPGGLARAAAASPRALGWIAYSAIGASIVGHAGMSWLLQRYPVTTLAPLTLPTPLLSAIIAVMVFDTPVSVQLVTGALVTFAGVAVVTWRSARKEAVPALVREWTREVRR